MKHFDFSRLFTLPILNCCKACPSAMCCKLDDGISRFNKFVLYIFHSVTWMVSIGYLLVGSWLVYLTSQISASANFQNVFDFAENLGIILIVLGILLFAFALIGNIGTLKENKILLQFFRVVLILLMIVCFITGCSFLIFSGKIRDTITQSLKIDYIKAYVDDPAAKSVMDAMQREFKCCGIDSYTDWANNIYYNCSSTKSAFRCKVPSSCCVTQETDRFCSGDVLSPTGSTLNIYGPSCSKLSISRINSIVYAVAGVLIGISVFQSLGIGSTSMLLNEISREIINVHSKNTYYTRTLKTHELMRPKIIQ